MVDGKLFRTDRTAETTTSVKGATINTWSSGKHRAFGGNVQAIMRPDGLPIWTSDVVAGHQHARRIDTRAPYHERMSAAHDFELLPHTAVPAEAVAAAEHGQVVYLTATASR